MDTNIVLVYCLCDDLLKWQHHRDDPQCALSDAEVMTIAIVAAMYFHGNQAMAGCFLSEQGYIKHTISRSRLCRRLAQVKHQFLTLFNLLGEIAKEQNAENIYIIDSLPVAVCDNYRIRRCKLYHDEAYRGIRLARGATSTASRFIWWSPKPDNRSSSSSRRVPSVIRPHSTSLTLTSRRTPGSSATKPTTSTLSKISWPNATSFSAAAQRELETPQGRLVAVLARYLSQTSRNRGQPD